MSGGHNNSERDDKVKTKWTHSGVPMEGGNKKFEVRFMLMM